MMLKHPLLPATMEVLHLLTDAGVDFMLIGAQARELLLYHVFDRPQGRATADIDIMVLVEDWPGYQTLKDTLITASKKVHQERQPHRLSYQVVSDNPNEAPWRYAIDIIPFGRIENPSGLLQWPPDAAVEMNLAGCREAWANAVTVKICDTLTVRCASLPALALLKLMAWSDRHGDTRRDAEDLLSMLKDYRSTGNEHRIYDDLPVDLQESLDYDPDLMGAALLGLDMGRLATPASMKIVSTLLSEPVSHDQLERAMHGGIGDKELARRFISAFREGTDLS